MIKVLIADDQALVRGALATLLNLEPDIEVVAQTGSGEDVADLVRAHEVDVALLDIDMPDLDGFGALQEIVATGLQARCLMVTTFGRPGYLTRALQLGAAGFVVKDSRPEDLAAAIRKVHAGGRVIDPSLAEESVFVGQNPLNERERQVLKLALTGSDAKQIAEELFLSEGTVRNLLSAAIGKTPARNRTDAAVTALNNGWI